MIPLLILAALTAAPGEARPAKKPRVLVLNLESELSDGRLAWRRGPAELLNDVIAARAKPVRVPERVRLGGAELAQKLFDPAALLPLARRTNADVVIALAMRIKVVPGKESTTVRGTGEVVAFDVTTAETLSSVTLPANGSGADAAAATEALYDAWSKLFLPIFERKVLAAWLVQSQRGAAFRVTVEGGKGKQREKLARALERIPKVTEVRRLAELDERISLEVRYRGTGEALVRGIFQHLGRRRAFRRLTRVGRDTNPIALEFSR